MFESIVAEEACYNVVAERAAPSEGSGGHVPLSAAGEPGQPGAEPGGEPGLDAAPGDAALELPPEAPTIAVSTDEYGDL